MANIVSIITTNGKIRVVFSLALVSKEMNVPGLLHWKGIKMISESALQRKGSHATKAMEHHDCSCVAENKLTMSGGDSDEDDQIKGSSYGPQRARKLASNGCMVSDETFGCCKPAWQKHCLKSKSNTTLCVT